MAVHILCRLKIGDFWPSSPSLSSFHQVKLAIFNGIVYEWSLTSIPKLINKKRKWKNVTKVEASLKQIVQRNQLWFAWIPAQRMAWRVKDEFRHGLLCIWTELLSCFLAHLPIWGLSLAPKLLPEGVFFGPGPFLI